SSRRRCGRASRRGRRPHRRRAAARGARDCGGPSRLSFRLGSGEDRMRPVDRRIARHIGSPQGGASTKGERMLTRLRKHATFSNVVALLALFVALGGAAYAGTKISGKSIKNNSIAKKKLKGNVLKGLDVCPSGATNYTNGICYSSQFAPNDWDVAARDCANKGLRLPDLGEGLLVTNKTPL